MRTGSLVFAFGLALLFACFADPSSSDTGGSTSDTSVTDSGPTGGPENRCERYCALVEDTCEGENRQYQSGQICEAVCASIDPGEVGVLGDTVECRYSQAIQAAEDPVQFCGPAGPTGGDVCGGRCGAFCTLAMNLCPGELALWPDVSACVADCGAFPDDVPYNASVASGDSFACRIYHLTVASLDPNTHCPHIVTDSPVCL